MYKMFPVKAANFGNAIYGNPNYGPTFGGGFDLYSFNGSLTPKGTTFTLNGYAHFGHSYDLDGVTSKEISNDISTVTELEVYKVTDVELLSWRITPDWNLEFRMYQVRSKTTGQPLNFRLCDTRGLEESQGIDTQELAYILDGNVTDGYQFNPSTPICSDTPGFKTAVTLKDKIHCVCFVIDGSTANILPGKMLEKIKSLQMKIHQKGIPQIVLLTKVDNVCPFVAEDLSTVFQSAAVGDLVDQVSQILGVPRGHVLPMKNYEKEIDLADNVNLLALLSLRQILRASEDYMYNHLDQMEENAQKADTLE